MDHHQGAGWARPRCSSRRRLGGWFPLTLNYQVLRDLLVVGIYVVALGFQMWIFAWWQNRAKRAAEVPAITTSDYGRPLVRKS